MRVADRIKSIRLSLGETAEVFGERFNPIANRAAVSNWENGRNLPNPKRLKVIARLGNISVDRLLNNDPLSNCTDQELLDELNKRNLL